MIKIISLAALILFASCSKPHYGCTKREQRKSAKHFRKSANWCVNEAMAQSLSHFPFKESDSTWSEIQTITDTITKYDTSIINDTVYITKYVDKVVNKVTTNTKEVRVEDGRKLGILQGQLDIANQKIADKDKEISELKVKVAKERASKQVYKWIIILAIAAFASVYGGRIIINKVLK